MRYFQDEAAFNKEMKIVKQILERKGYVLESDHVYAYSMQYNAAFEDVRDWLLNNGYRGKVDHAGHYDKVAVYGLYDPSRISLKSMQDKLLAEARAQV